MTVRVKAIMNRVKGVNSRMNRIVSLMASCCDFRIIDISRSPDYDG